MNISKKKQQKIACGTRRKDKKTSNAKIPTDKLEEMASKATANGPLGSFKQLSNYDILAILELAK